NRTFASQADMLASGCQTAGTTGTTTYALTVIKTGAGIGTITSSPTGINCGTACTATFNSGAQVVITAAAAAGSLSRGWGGCCSGTGTCTVTMNGNRSVTAAFAVSATPPTVSTGTIYLPQIADGGGYSTTFTFLNTSGSSVTGRLRFFNEDGTAK